MGKRGPLSDSADFHISAAAGQSGHPKNARARGSLARCRLDAMPERLDRVDVELAERTVTLTWDVRGQLLAEMRHLPSLEPVRRDFENAGASRPVRIERDLRGDVFQVIEAWARQTPGGLRALPDGILDLRNALVDEPASCRRPEPTSVARLRARWPLHGPVSPRAFAPQAVTASAGLTLDRRKPRRSRAFVVSRRPDSNRGPLHYE